MRKLVLLFAFILLGVSANAEEIITQETPTLNEETVNEIIDQPSPITLTGGTVFNWVDITQVERDEQIQQYQKILFNEEIERIKKKEFKQECSIQQYTYANNHTFFTQEKNFHAKRILVLQMKYAFLHFLVSVSQCKTTPFIPLIIIFNKRKGIHLSLNSSTKAK